MSRSIQNVDFAFRGRRPRSEVQKIWTSFMEAPSCAPSIEFSSDTLAEPNKTCGAAAGAKEEEEDQ